MPNEEDFPLVVFSILSFPKKNESISEDENQGRCSISRYAEMSLDDHEYPQ